MAGREEAEEENISAVVGAGGGIVLVGRSTTEAGLDWTSVLN